MGKMKELFMELHEPENDFIDADYLYEEWKEGQALERTAFLEVEGEEGQASEMIEKVGGENV